MRHRPIRLILGAAFVALWLSVPSAARADAIGPPEACPKGARAQVDHAGSRCIATSCTADSECGGTQRCEEAPLCVREETYRTYRSFPPREGDRGEEHTRVIAVAPCEAGACAGSLRCISGTRCVPAAPSAAATAAVAAEEAPPSEVAPAPTPVASDEGPTPTSSEERPVAASSGGGCAVGASHPTWRACLCVVALFGIRRRAPRARPRAQRWT